MDVSVSVGNRGRRRVFAPHEVSRVDWLKSSGILHYYANHVDNSCEFPLQNKILLYEKVPIFGMCEVDSGHKKGLFGECDGFAAASDIASVGGVPAGEAFHA